jgi:putative oxidoreductase
MLGTRTLIRPLLAAPFILGGIKSLRAPEVVAPAAADIATPIAEKLGLPSDDPEMLVKVNAAVQVGAGALLVFGFFPRAASLVLAASLVPTTLAGHRFWEKQGDERTVQMTQFAKNAGLLGGLLAAALDTGGRPSVFWASRRAAQHAAGSVSDAAQTVATSLEHAYHSLPGIS